MEGKLKSSNIWGSWAGIVFPVIYLSILGLIILISAGANRADPYLIVTKQALWLCIACVAGIATTFIDISLLKKFAIPIAIITFILLIAVLIPQIGKEVNGSRRWIAIGSIAIQPSDLAKFSLIILLSSYLYNNQRRIKTFIHGLLKPLLIIGFFCLPIIKEPDFGTTALCGAIGIILIYLAGAKLRYMFAVFSPLLLVFCVLVYFDPVRMRRVLSFLDVEGTKADGSYQLYQAILAFGSGGVFGSGIGQGRQQLSFLPEAHTDFVFAIVGEELGIFATYSVVIAFMIIFFSAIHILKKAPNIYEFSLATGALMMIIIQALFNMCVVTGLTPTKGISLPFISYGGSNLVAMFAFAGILVNCALRWSKPEIIKIGEL